MTKNDVAACKARSAYERAKDALLARQRVVAVSSPKRYYERGLIVDSGERGSGQKTNIDDPFEWDDLSALMMDYDVLAARVRELEGRTCDKCEHQNLQHDPTEPWCGWNILPCVDVGNTCGAWKAKALDK